MLKSKEKMEQRPPRFDGPLKEARRRLLSLAPQLARTANKGTHWARGVEARNRQRLELILSAPTDHLVRCQSQQRSSAVRVRGLDATIRDGGNVSMKSETQRNVRSGMEYLTFETSTRDSLTLAWSQGDLVNRICWERRTETGLLGCDLVAFSP